MSRLRTINHAIQDLKPGDWVIQRRNGQHETPVEVARVTPTQIHTWWIFNHNGVDKYNSTDGAPISNSSGCIVRRATPAQIEAHKADQQRQRDEATARNQAKDAADAQRAELSAMLPDGVYLQRSNGNTWDVVISNCDDARIRILSELFEREGY